MGRIGKHAKPLTDVEETYMDLMIKIKQAEEFLHREKIKSIPEVELDEIDDLELFPPFSKVRKTTPAEHDIKSDMIEDPVKKTDLSQIDQIRTYTTYADIENSVKLTFGEWLEARKKGIFILFMIVSVFICRLVMVWGKPSLFTLFCKTYVYVGSLCIITIFIRWMITGGLHRYLNEEA